MRKARREETEEKAKKRKKLKSFSKQDILAKIKLDNKTKLTILGLVIVIIIWVLIANYTTFGLVLNKKITSKDAVQVELANSNNVVLPFLDKVLIQSENTITCYSKLGNKEWEIKLEDMVNAKIATSGKYIQVINKDKNLVYVFKNKYEVARIKLEGKIYSGSINSNGDSVIEYNSNGTKTALAIYNNSGKIKYNVKLSNKIIGKYILSDNSRYLAYIDVNIDGISANTNVNVIDLKNISEDKTNYKTAYTIENSLAYDIYWINSKLVIRTEDENVIYNASNEKRSDFEIGSKAIVEIQNDNKNFVYTYIDGSGNYKLDIARMGKEKIKIIELNEEAKHLLYENGISYVCYNKKIEAYNNFGMKIKEYDSDIVITKPVVFNNGKSIAMTISNKLIMFTL